MRLPMLRRLLPLLCVAPLACPAAEGWTRFRGPAGAGAGELPELPSALTSDHYRWNVALPGRGHSSPVVWQERIYTASEEDGGKRRCIACLDAASGEILWTTWLDCAKQPMHSDNSPAAATPAVDADGVCIGWVAGDRVEALALDHGGKRVWRRDLCAFAARHGPGASVAIAGDTVVVSNDQESPEAALFGLDRKTGATRWRVARQPGNPSYATPVPRALDGGGSELVFSSPAHGLTGLDPATGKTNWEVGGLFTMNVVASPVLGEGMLLATAGRGGSREAAVLALDGGKPRLAYRPERKLPYVPTPVVVGPNVFLWEDQGTVSCLELKTGKELWSERVTGPTYTSPVTDGKRLFGISRKGELVVLAAAPEYNELGRHQLPEGTHATPAIADGSLFVRTFTRLIRLGK